MNEPSAEPHTETAPPDESDAAPLRAPADLDEIQSCIETLLFMADKPIARARLKEMLGEGLDEALFDRAIEAMRLCYSAAHHGVELVAVSGGWQLRTKPARADLARRLAKVRLQRLSSGALETLAIVAYQQPVMKEEIDRVRGVDSSHFVRLLLDRKLVQIAGRSELPGRPMLYSTTDEFLEIFTLNDLSALPPLREIEQMVPTSESPRPGEPGEAPENAEDADPRVREMRKLVSEMKLASETQATNEYNPGDDEVLLAEIRERVKAIRVTTPTLEARDAHDSRDSRELGEVAPQKAESKADYEQPIQPSLAPAAD